MNIPTPRWSRLYEIADEVFALAPWKNSFEEDLCAIQPNADGPVYFVSIIDVEHWVENVERFGGLFHRLAGKLQHLREMARAVGQSWLLGHAGTRRLYAGAS